MRIRRTESLAVVVDIQERLFPHIHEHEQLAQNCLRLLTGLQALEIPIIVTEQYSKGLGPTIAPIRDAMTSFAAIEKMAFSCCGAPDFLTALERADKKNIILLGIEAHVCVLQTSLDLLENNFVPVLIEDCVASRKASDKHTAVQRMRSEGAVVSSYESILFELCGVAGTETFKTISRIVK